MQRLIQLISGEIVKFDSHLLMLGRGAGFNIDNCIRIYNRECKTDFTLKDIENLLILL
jgi:hypothetical protein